MAAVLSPRALTFPHNILQETRDITSITKMDRTSPARPSLPSISSLINDVDMQTETAPLRSPALEQQRSVASLSQPPTPDRMSFPGSPQIRLPPSPPLPGTSSFDFIPRSSPAISTPTGYGQSTNTYFAPSPVRTSSNVFTTQKSAYPPLPEQQQWSAAGSPNSSRRASDQSTPSTSAQSTKSDTDMSDTASVNSGLSQQRPLPANFPPALPSPSNQLPPIIDPQFQHHHHYSAASSPSYSPSSDRYQCPTCQKAFSRPSSLKIHIYSHTGEKPFKCKYDGCGKFFSVRSNMKRHEKGCHGVETSSTDGNSPKAS